MKVANDENTTLEKEYEVYKTIKYIQASVDEINAKYKNVFIDDYTGDSYIQAVRVNCDNDEIMISINKMGTRYFPVKCGLVSAQTYLFNISKITDFAVFIKTLSTLFSENKIQKPTNNPNGICGYDDFVTIVTADVRS